MSRYLSILIGLLTVLSPFAQGAVLATYSSDFDSGAAEGNPYDTAVVTGGNWTYTTDSGRTVATALDNALAGANRVITVSLSGVSQFGANATETAQRGWIFSSTFRILQGNASSELTHATNPDQGPLALLGVNTESTVGRSVRLGFTNHGGVGDTGRIGFFNAGNSGYLETIDYNVDSLVGDGLYHTVDLYKYDQSGTTVVSAYLDGSLLLTRDYTNFDAGSANARNVFALSSLSPTPLSELNLDSTSITIYDNLTDSSPVPEPQTLGLIIMGAALIAWVRRMRVV